MEPPRRLVNSFGKLTSSDVSKAWFIIMEGCNRVDYAGWVCQGKAIKDLRDQSPPIFGLAIDCHCEDVKQTIKGYSQYDSADVQDRRTIYRERFAHVLYGTLQCTSMNLVLPQKTDSTPAL